MHKIYIDKFTQKCNNRITKKVVYIVERIFMYKVGCSKMKIRLIAMLVAVLIILTACSNENIEHEDKLEVVPQQSESEIEEEIDYSEYFDAAKYLAERITSSIPKDDFESGTIYGSTVFYLLINLVPDYENPDIRSPYPDIAHVEADGCHFVKENCETALYELLGIENYEFNFGNFNYSFDEEAGEYIMDWGFGTGAYVIPTALEAESTEKGVAVNFVATKIENVKGNPVWVPFGDYTVYFELITENGKTFLRYAGLSGVHYPGADLSKELMNYPEMTYDMSVEAFVNRENDYYIHYLYRMLLSSNVKGITGLTDLEYTGFEQGNKFDDKILMNMFAISAEDISNSFIDETGNKTVISIDYINSFLGKYFDNVDFNPENWGSNFEYSEDKKSIIVAGLGSYDLPKYNVYDIDSVTDNGDGTVTVVIITKHADFIDDKFVPTGEDEQRKTIVFEPKENSCKIISYKCENLLQ